MQRSRGERLDGRERRQEGGGRVAGRDRSRRSWRCFSERSCRMRSLAFSARRFSRRCSRSTLRRHPSRTFSALRNAAASPGAAGRQPHLSRSLRCLRSSPVSVGSPLSLSSSPSLLDSPSLSLPSSPPSLRGFLSLCSSSLLSSLLERFLCLWLRLRDALLLPFFRRCLRERSRERERERRDRLLRCPRDRERDLSRRCSLRRLSRSLLLRLSPRSGEDAEEFRSLCTRPRGSFSILLHAAKLGTSSRMGWLTGLPLLGTAPTMNQRTDSPITLLGPVGPCFPLFWPVKVLAKCSLFHPAQSAHLSAVFPSALAPYPHHSAHAP